MVEQNPLVTPANKGTQAIPGAKAGALGFMGANIAKQLLAKKFKGYGHLTTSSLASATFGGLVGGLGGSLIPRTKKAAVQFNIGGYNMHNYKNYVLEAIEKQAGITGSIEGFGKRVSGKNVSQAKATLEKAKKWRDTYRNLGDAAKARKWEQHTNTAERLVKREQSLTSKARKQLAVSTGSTIAGTAAIAANKDKLKMYANDVINDGLKLPDNASNSQKYKAQSTRDARKALAYGFGGLTLSKGAIRAGNKHPMVRKALTGASIGALAPATYYAAKSQVNDFKSWRAKRKENKEKTAMINEKENDILMNEELYNICELAKTAADMSIPLEGQPVPEAGSQGVMGMTNNATLSPTSAGASVYGDSFGQRMLAKAKEMAACARAKLAADEETATEPSEHEKYKAKFKNDAKKYIGSGLAANALGAGALYAAKKGKLGVAAGLGAAALPTALYSGVQGWKGLYHGYKTLRTRPKNNAAEKTASIEETGIYPEEAAYAMDSAEALYNDCLEKMAYAEELYADAADYLNYCDYMEKQANEFVPIAGSALGSAAGATAGAMIGGRFNAQRAGAALGAAVGGAVGGPAASALENFVATARQ